MNIANYRFVALGITAALFGATDLLVTVLTPGRNHGWLLAPPIVAAVLVLFAFPYVLSFFESQQDRIDSQVRELETLHAMDTAIVSEMEIGRVLLVAVQSLMRAVDAVAGGVVLFDAVTCKVSEQCVKTPDHTGPEADSFLATARSGEQTNPLWDVLIYPLRGLSAQVSGFVSAGRARPGKPFTAAERALVSALSGTVGVAVSNAYALRSAREAASVIAEAEQIRADLKRERRVAQVLTEGLLPSIPPTIGNFAFSKRYEAQSDEAEVGGDIYDLFPLAENRWGIVIADVSGKGLDAAKKTAMVKYSLRSYAREHDSPARVVARLNDTLSDEEQLTGFVTLFYGVLHTDTGLLRYASAGHEPPVLRRESGDFENLEPTGMVVGAMRDMPYDDGEVPLLPGDGLLLYTDGLTEARSAASGEFLAIDGVERMLTGLRGTAAGEVADALWERVEQFTGARQLDDTALLWIECVAPA